MFGVCKRDSSDGESRGGFFWWFFLVDIVVEDGMVLL